MCAVATASFEKSPQDHLRRGFEGERYKSAQLSVDNDIHAVEKVPELLSVAKLVIYSLEHHVPPGTLSRARTW